MLRALTSADLDRICRYRELMFLEAGRDPEALCGMSVPFRQWLSPRLADGRYFGFMVQTDCGTVGGVGLMEIDWPPHPMHPDQARRGYVLNLYVEAAYRRRGIARELMNAADQEFRRRGVKYAVLHATEAAGDFYRGLGWSGTREMAKAL